VTRVTTSRAASTKSAAAKAAKASAPTKPLPKTAAKVAATKTIAPQKPVAPASTAPLSAPTTPAAQALTKEHVVQAVAPKPTTVPAPAKPDAAPLAVDPSKPIVLEKPERFNPPSHGARLPRSTPKHYGGPLTTDEVRAQAKKSYPGLPPPPNTWSHWFINSRGVHMFITLVSSMPSVVVYSLP
jgi:hypothetical protein